MEFFDLVTVPRIIFGSGSIRQAGAIASEFGRHALLVTGKSQARAGKLGDSLDAHALQITVFSIPGEPTVDDIREGVRLAKRAGCDVIIGFGGGSALDASKAIAILLANEGDIFDYLEVIGDGKKLANPGLPVITIPTTAGTGAEVTRNAVIGAPGQHVKVSLRSSGMLAKVAIVDPQATLELPPEVTASSGMDALAQLVEPFISNQANRVTDIYCLEGLRRIRESLEIAYRDGGNLSARADMSFASLLSGLALANAKLGIVHGFASVIGGMFPAPHGAVCACLLPAATAVNLRAISHRGDADETLEKLSLLSKILTGDQSARPEDGVSWLERLVDTINIPPLSAYGVTRSDFSTIIEKTRLASSTTGNPVVLTTGEMEAILERVLYKKWSHQ